MNNKRQGLHKMVDDETRLTIERAKERVRARSLRMLEEQRKRTGHGFITAVGTGSGRTMPTGDFSCSMSAWDDGPVTYRLRRFSGYMFEMYEQLKLAEDGKSLILAQRISGPGGTEQLVSANMPIPH